MKKYLIAFVFAAIFSAKNVRADGTDYDITVSSVKWVVSYSTGPAKGLYVYINGNKVYRYLIDASGNSADQGKTLMSLFLTALSTGRNVNVGYIGSSPSSGGTPVDMYEATIR